MGPKGQVAMEKAIRNKLGVEPGWHTRQLLGDDHVELYLIPPEHDRSLAGRLSKYVKRSLSTSEALREARDEAWAQVAEKQEGG